MSKLTNIMRLIINNKRSLEDVVGKAKIFLNPQISYIEKTYDYKFSLNNKYSVIDLDSMAYSIAIAEELSKYRIVFEKRMPCLLGIFGDQYEELFNYLFDIIDNEQQLFSMQIEDLRNMAIQDVKNGMINCCNYLVTQAEALHAINGDLEFSYSDVINFRNSMK